jgi:uncharacterized protein (DUF433 family)
LGKPHKHSNDLLGTGRADALQTCLRSSPDTELTQNDFELKCQETECSFTIKAWLREGFQMTDIDWSQCPEVESVPGKMSGAWVLRDTRMPVSGVLENLEAGASIDDIMEWFDGLDREQVEAVIAFAARSREQALAYTK